MDPLRIHNIDVDSVPHLQRTVQKSYDLLWDLMARLEKLEISVAQPPKSSPNDFTEEERILIHALIASSSETIAAPVPNVPVLTVLPDIHTAKPGDLVIVAGALYYFDSTAGPGWTAL